MKFKYYMRGFGTGVLFATIVLMLTLAIKNNMPSDKNKTINSSGNLVMENNNSSSDSQEKKTDGNEKVSEKLNTQDITTPIEQNDSTAQEETMVSEETTVPEETTMQEETTVQEGTTVPEETTVQEETTTQELTDITQPSIPATEPLPATETIFTLSITPGMTSNDAAAILESYGIVESGYDFNMYLYNNGYESRLRVGNYEIKAGLSYAEIAEIITR